MNRIYKIGKKIVSSLKLFRINYFVFYSSKNCFLNQHSRLRSSIPRKIYYLRITELCRLMMAYGSDKGGFVGMSLHNYTSLYNQLFKKIRDKEINLFELGIGTTDRSIPFNMGGAGVPGASLRGWRDYFPKGNIYSADIDRSILFEDERIKTFYCNQKDADSVNALWDNKGLENEFDIIIDDGCHEYEANRIFFENSVKKLQNGGFYIIEDVHKSEFAKWNKYISESSHMYTFAFIKLPNPYNSKDNNLIIIEKK